MTPIKNRLRKTARSASSLPLSNLRSMSLSGSESISSQNLENHSLAFDSVQDTILTPTEITYNSMTEPSITKTSQSSFCIQIPHSPTNIEFEIELLSQKPSLPIITTFQESTEQDTFVLNSIYPIYDSDGKVNARIISKRHYLKDYLVSSRNAHISVSSATIHDKQVLTTDIKNTKITDSSEHITEQTPLADNLHNFINHTLTKSSKPLISIYKSELKASSPSTPLPPQPKSKSPLPKPKKSKKASYSTKIMKISKSKQTNKLQRKTATPTNQSTTLLTQQTPIELSQPFLNPNNFLTNYLMLQTLISQSQQSSLLQK